MQDYRVKGQITLGFEFVVSANTPQDAESVTHHLVRCNADGEAILDVATTSIETLDD
jgi:hypothetical protein